MKKKERKEEEEEKKVREISEKNIFAYDANREARFIYRWGWDYSSTQCC